MSRVSSAPTRLASLAPACVIACSVAFLIGCSIACTPRITAAQPSSTSFTLSTSLSTVNFAGIGGRFGAIVVQGTLARRVSDAVGVELNGFALVPGGSATADPSCLASQPCGSFSTPSAIVGALVGPVAYIGASGLRLSAGAGVARATGGTGFSPRATGVGAVAVEWRIRPRSRFSPSAGMRLATLASPLAGARLLLLPGLGVTF